MGNPFERFWCYVHQMTKEMKTKNFYCLSRSLSLGGLGELLRKRRVPYRRLGLDCCSLFLARNDII